MSGRRFAWFLTGFAVALMLGALGAPVRAQEQPRNASPSYQTGPSTPRSGTLPVPDVADGYAAPGIPAPVPEDDPSMTPEEQDLLDPSPRAGQRPVIQDGDPNYPAEPTQLRDGIIDVGEPAPPEDGTDPTIVDTRDPEDIAAFELPAQNAGFDPLLFQIEDLDPIRDNRLTQRLFRREPFDPVGIRIGSFVLFPEAEFSGSYYSNVFRAPNAESDVAFNVLPSARLVSNWSRHALEFRTTGDLSFFSDFDSENDKGYLVESRGRLDIARRTNLQGLISHEQSQESRSALDASSAGTRATVTVDRAEASFNHRFNRLSLQFRGSVSDYAYGDTTNGAVVASNSDRDMTETQETVRATWEFKPTLSAFTEVAVNQRNYNSVALSDGINRSSDGQRYRTGLAFGNTGKIVRGEIGIGYGVQTPDDKRLADIDGLILDANATWRVSDVTSLLFMARSDVSETTTANVGGSFSRSAGVEVRHELQRYLIASAGLTYTTQDSGDGVIDEAELRSALGLEYYATPETILFGRYAHTTFNAVGSASDYDNDEVHLGVRWRR